MTIKNLWKIITLDCGCHGDIVEMQANTGGKSLFYSCPKYYSVYRAPNDPACANRISIDDYQAAVLHLSDVIANNVANNIEENLLGYTWEYKGISFTVTKHEPEDIHLAVVNSRALR